MAFLLDTGIFAAVGSNSAVMSGAKLYFYAAGTTTPLDTYTSIDLDPLSKNTNPVVADANGRFPPIWLVDALYKIRLTDSLDVVIETRDNVGPNAAVDLAASTGAGLVGFSHSASYSASTVGKTLQQRFMAITDAPFSAPTDGTSSCVAALNAIAALSAGDLHIFIPPGDWVIDGEVLFTDKNVTLVGAGNGLTRLHFTTTSAKIKFRDTSTTTGWNIHKRFNASDMTLVKDMTTSANDGSVALDLIWSYAGITASWEHATLSDITIQAQSSTKYWDTGVRLTDVGCVRFDNVRFDNAGAQAANSRAAFEIVRSAATNVTGFQFSNCFIYGSTAGIRLTHSAAPAGTIEGIYIVNQETVGVRYAVYDDNQGTADTTRQVNGISYVGGHWSASFAGMKFGWVANLYITGDNFTHNNLADTGAALEAGISITTSAQIINIVSSRFLVGASAATGKPMLLLPTDANVDKVAVIGGSAEGWDAIVDQAGTPSTVNAKIRILSVATSASVAVSTTGSGFRAMSTVGGNITQATGTTVSFGVTFNGAPAVTLLNRNAYVTNYRADSVTTTGFTLVHDGAGSQAFSWTATGL